MNPRSRDASAHDNDDALASIAAVRGMTISRLPSTPYEPFLVAR
jgi:hypothetical protein